MDCFWLSYAQVKQIPVKDKRRQSEKSNAHWAPDSVRRTAGSFF